MKAPNTPPNEPERLLALERYEILDTPGEAAFDALTALAAHVLDVPIALVSLVDADRQWFKSRHGLAASQTPRDVSFCGHVVAERSPLVVSDATCDDRFSDNPLVCGDPRVRFYAGVPLETSDGYVLGTLCAIDHVPREITPEQHQLLSLLARQAVSLLELRYAHLRLAAREAELTRREAEQRAIVESSFDVISTLDELGRLEGVNPAGERLLGYRSAELIGMPFSDLLAVGSRRYPAIGVEEFDGRRDAVSANGEVAVRRKDGSQFPAELHIAELRLEGPKRFAAILRDISERQRVERLKSEFVATVSHELRTPLTSIRGALGLVAGGALGPVSEPVKDCLGIAVANADRLSRIIDDMLDLERIQAGRIPLNRRVVSLARVMEAAMSANQPFASSFRVRLALIGELPAVDIVVDEDRLAQVLANLISNAVKFSPTDKPVELSAVARGSRVRLEIRDHGPGVPDAFQARIFQRFAQADASDARRKGGAGLGLSISKAIVGAMKGEIGFENLAPGGARFFVEFTCLANERPGDEELEGRPRILVCEDDLEEAIEIRGALEQLGADVHVAPTLGRARELIAKFEYVVVLLDLMLPDGDGAELVADIRRRPNTERASIVVLSKLTVAAAHSHLGAAAREVIHFLAKPIDAGRLRAAAERAADASRRGPWRVLHIEADSGRHQELRTLLPPCALTTRTRLVDAAGEQCDLLLLESSLLEHGADALSALAAPAQVILFSHDEPTPDLAERAARLIASSGSLRPGPASRPPTERRTDDVS